MVFALATKHCCRSILDTLYMTRQGMREVLSSSESRELSVGAWLWDGRPRNRGSMCGRGRDVCLVHRPAVGLSRLLVTEGAQPLIPQHPTYGQVRMRFNSTHEQT
jgi:hypothetical protein